MASFNTVKPGDVLWDVHRERAGHTTTTRMGCWPVRVIEVDPEKRVAMCSWNGNKPKRYTERRLARLRRSKPKK